MNTLETVSMKNFKVEHILGHLLIITIPFLWITLLPLQTLGEPSLNHLKWRRATAEYTKIHKCQSALNVYYTITKKFINFTFTNLTKERYYNSEVHLYKSRHTPNYLFLDFTFKDGRGILPSKSDNQRKLVCKDKLGNCRLVKFTICRN